MTGISIVIPAHNKPNRLRLTLAALVGQIADTNTEIIVVADGTTPEVKDVISTYDSAVRVLETSGLGRAAARNHGAENARGNLLIFVDDDILTETGFIQHHEQEHHQTAALTFVHGRIREIPGLSRVDDPRNGGPGCPPIDPAHLLAGEWTPGQVRISANALQRAVDASHNEDLEVNAPWLAGAGANISLPKKLWLAVEGFDEGYGLSWGMEDLDFAYRLHDAGYEVRYCSKATGYHMSHYNPARWNDHNENLAKFQQRAACPEAMALGSLLAPNGSPENYAAAVRQIRAENTCPPSGRA